MPYNLSFLHTPLRTEPSSRCDCVSTPTVHLCFGTKWKGESFSFLHHALMTGPLFVCSGNEMCCSSKMPLFRVLILPFLHLKEMHLECTQTLHSWGLQGSQVRNKPNFHLSANPTANVATLYMSQWMDSSLIIMVKSKKEGLIVDQHYKSSIALWITTFLYSYLHMFKHKVKDFLWD